MEFYYISYSFTEKKELKNTLYLYKFKFHYIIQNYQAVI